MASELALSESEFEELLSLTGEPQEIPAPTKAPRVVTAESPGPPPAKSPGPPPAKSPGPPPAKSPGPPPAKSPGPPPAKSPAPSPAKSPAPSPAKSPAPSPAKSPDPSPAKSPGEDEIVPQSLPSVGRQKSYIEEHAGILNRETKLAILSVVMMEIGSSVLMETGTSREVDVDLDAVATENPEVLGHIYNIVRARRESLNQPLHHIESGRGSGTH
jgi:hypothetical protein